MIFYKNCPICKGTGREAIPNKYGSGIMALVTCRLCTQRNKDKEEFKELIAE